MSEIPQNSGESGRDKNGKFVEGHVKLGGAVAGSFSLVSMLKIELQKCPEGQDKKTYADLLIQRIMKKAISDGDDQQIKNILQYVEGMPKQNLKVEGEIKTALVKFIGDDNGDSGSIDTTGV